MWKNDLLKTKIRLSYEKRKDLVLAHGHYRIKNTISIIDYKIGEVRLESG